MSMCKHNMLLPIVRLVGGGLFNNSDKIVIAPEKMV